MKQEEVSTAEKAPVARGNEAGAACVKTESAGKTATQLIFDEGFIGTDEVNARLSNTNRFDLVRTRDRFGNLTVNREHTKTVALLHRLLRAVRNGKMRVILDHAGLRWDETPNRARVDGVVGTAAVFRTQITWSMLIELLDLDECGSPSEKFIVLRGELSAWLTALQGKSAKVAFAALERVTEDSRAAFEYFAREVRRHGGPEAVGAADSEIIIPPPLLRLLTAMSDSEGANLMLLANLRLLQLDEAMRQAALHMRCNVHYDVSGMKNMVSMRDGWVGRQCKCANSLALLSSVTMLKAEIRFLLRTKLVKCKGAPSLEADKFRHACLELFFPKDTPKGAKNRFIMETLLPGDWRSSTPQYYGPLSIKEALHWAVLYVPSAMVPRAVEILNIARWCHQEQPNRDIGKLVSPHHMMAPAYPKAMTAKNVQEDAITCDEATLRLGRAPQEASAGAAKEVDWDALDFSTKFNMLQSIRVESTTDWFSGKRGLADSALMALCLRPYTRRCARAFKTGSAEEASECTRRHVEDGAPVEAREYALFRAAMLTNDLLQLEEIGELLRNVEDDLLWTPYRFAEGETLAAAAWPLRLLGRLAGFEEDRNTSRNRIYPIRMFRASRHVPPEIRVQCYEERNDTPCIIDDYGGVFMDHFATSEEEFQFGLVTVAASVEVNMQTLEDEHGLEKRRQRTGATHATDIQKMSVGSLCRRRVRRGWNLSKIAVSYDVYCPFGQKR